MKRLVKYLIDRKFVIIEERLNDYHFNELYFKLRGKYSEDIEQINIDKIERINPDKFFYSCHSCEGRNLLK